jgi:hypothetical protein
MRNTCGHENSCAGRGFHLFIMQPESQCSLENVPGLVVRLVDVQVARTAPTPLVNLKGTSGCSDWRLVMSARFDVWNNNGVSHHFTCSSLHRLYRTTRTCCAMCIVAASTAGSYNRYII